MRENVSGSTFLKSTNVFMPGFILSKRRWGIMFISGMNQANWRAKGPKSWKPLI